MAEEIKADVNIGDMLLGNDTPAVNNDTPAIKEPVVTPPAITEPVVTPPIQEPTSEIVLTDDVSPVTPPNTTPAFDESKWLQENIGITDMAQIKQRLTEYEHLQAKLTEAEGKIAASGHKNKASELFDELLTKSGGDLKANADYIKRSLDLLTTDENTLQPVDLIKYEIKSQYPAMQDADIEAYIAKKYSLTDLADEQDKAAGKAQMIMDSAKALTSIKEMKAKLMTGENRSAALQNVQLEKIAQQWQPAAKKVIEDFKEIPLDLGKIAGKNAVLNFKIPAEAKQKYTEFVYNAMVAQGVEPTAESLEVATQIARATYISENLPHITRYIATQLQSQQIKKEIETYHNREALGKGGSIATPAAKTQQDLIYEALGGK